MISKWANIGGKLQRILLTEVEMDELMDELLYNNTKEIERCMKKMDEKGLKNPIILQCLADKQLTASFTAIINAIDNKISKLKGGESLIEKAFNKT